MRGGYRTVVLSAIVVLFGLGSRAEASRRPARSTPALPDRAEVLTARFERFIGNRDLDAFVREVGAGFREPVLVRFLLASDLDARRAAAFALGQVGSFRVNVALARGLRDKDPVVRALTNEALRGVWFRAGTPAQNDHLRRIMAEINRGAYDRAVAMADELVKEAPEFAEAYNQRAIAHFFSNRPAESSEDCRKTLDLNPVHLGALGGLAQCLLKLDDRAGALKTYRRASEVSPFDESLKAAILELEAEP